ncbi:MAG: hypothetical protein ABH821_03820 [archaeon]
MKLKLIVLMVLITASLMFSGCVTETPTPNNEVSPGGSDGGLIKAPDNQEQTVQEQALYECQLLCGNAALGGRDLSMGPCLSNEVIPDWVCDIAHNPRQDVDNLPENQCTAFREKLASHFIELNENCETIQIQ